MSVPREEAPVEDLDRRSWMGLLARSAPADLDAAWQRLPEPPAWHWLRRPETGLVMVRGRIGGDGRPFNLGEMTVTRCSLVTADGWTGHGFVAGRDHRHARLAALFDALLQTPGQARQLMRDLLPALASKLDRAREDKAARTAATKVEFFTLVRGEDDPE